MYKLIVYYVKKNKVDPYNKTS